MCKVLSMGLSLVSVPLLIHCLGNEKYGIWASVMSMTSWIYLLDLGIGGGLRNRLSESLAREDFIAARRYLNITYIMLGGVCFFVFLCAICILKVINIADLLHCYPANENMDCIVGIALGFACVNFLFSLVNNILYALQRAGWVSIYNVIGQSFWILGILVSIYWNFHLLTAIAMVEGIAQFLKNIIATLDVFNRCPTLRFSLCFNKSMLLEGSKVLSLGLQFFIVQIASLTFTSTDNILILKYLGAESVTEYSLCYKYFSTIETTFLALITPLCSAYTVAYTKQNLFQIKKMMRKSLMLYGVFIILTILATGIFPFFLKIWTQSDISVSVHLLFLMMIYFILLMFCHNFSMIVSGVGKLKLITFAVGIEAIINVPISLFLAVYCNLGLNGIIGGSIISILISAGVYPYVTVKEIRKLKEEL